LLGLNPLQVKAEGSSRGGAFGGREAPTQKIECKRNSYCKVGGGVMGSNHYEKNRYMSGTGGGQVGGGQRDQKGRVPSYGAVRYIEE